MGLPELNVNEGSLVDLTRKALEVNGRIADLETELKKLKAEVNEGAVALRDGELAKANYVGLVRITGEDMPACRVELRTNATSAIHVDDSEILDSLLGAARPLVFQRKSCITEIIDPAKVIADLVKAGKNPWDHLTLSIKGEQDSVIAGCTEAVIVAEAFKPTEGWLTTLNNIANTLTETAKEYIAEYIKKATTAVTVLGSRGKAKSK